MPRAKLAAEIHLIVFDLIVTAPVAGRFSKCSQSPHLPNLRLPPTPTIVLVYFLVFFIVHFRGFAWTLLHPQHFLLSITYLVDRPSSPHSLLLPNDWNIGH